MISCFKPHQSKWVISKRIIWCGILNICLWRSACIYFINLHVLDSTNSGQFSPFRKIHVSTMTRRCFKSTWSEIFVLVLFIIVSVCILTDMVLIHNVNEYFMEKRFRAMNKLMISTSVILPFVWMNLGMFQVNYIIQLCLK